MYVCEKKKNAFGMILKQAGFKSETEYNIDQKLNA
jgi:hypothetical protein